MLASAAAREHTEKNISRRARGNIEMRPQRGNLDATRIHSGGGGGGGGSSINDWAKTRLGVIDLRGRGELDICLTALLQNQPFIANT
jgi:hypothetical protein